MNVAQPDFTADVEAIGALDVAQEILDLCCRITGMGFAAIARVTEDRWVCCASRDLIAFGLGAGGELKIETTICNEIRQSGRLVVIDHVSEDAAYCGHPTPKMYGFQSYISVPILRRDGSMFGTLCAIDPQPHVVNTVETIGTFKMFANLIARHLDAIQRAETAETSLADAQRMAGLRDEFLAVLGHDLRSPLAALGSGLRLIGDEADGEGENREIISLMQNAAQRMGLLLNNLTDLTRLRLGDERLHIQSAKSWLSPVLQRVVADTAPRHSVQRIETKFELAREVYCDVQRIQQMFANMLAKALQYASKDNPVLATASVKDGILDISVSAQSAVLSADERAHLLKPVARGQGLDIDLMIAAEIAIAHGGTLQTSSTAEGARFTFRMPVGGPSATM
jgi:signal transduction histidine kinase